MSRSYIEKALLDPDISNEKFKNMLRNIKGSLSHRIEEDLSDLLEIAIRNCSLSRIAVLNEVAKELDLEIVGSEPERIIPYNEFIEYLLHEHFLCEDHDNSNMELAFRSSFYSNNLQIPAVIYDHFWQHVEDKSYCVEKMQQYLKENLNHYYNSLLECFKILSSEQIKEKMILSTKTINFFLQTSTTENMLFVLEKVNRETDMFEKLMTKICILPKVILRSDKLTAADIERLNFIYKIETDSILKEYENHPGGALQLALENDSFEVALYFLNKVNLKGKYNTSKFKNSLRIDYHILKTKLSLISFHEKKTKKEWSSAVVLPRSADQLGCLKKNFPEEFSSLERKSSAFKTKKDAQLLRQVSTQLLYRWKYLVGIKRLQEVQIMQVSISKREDPLYFSVIAGSPADVTKDIADQDLRQAIRSRSGTIQSNDIIKEYVTRNYEIERSRRYSNKLKVRFPQSKFSGTDIVIQEMLKTKCYSKFPNFPTYSQFSSEALTNMNRKTYFLVPSGFVNRERHAEEFLCDFADYLRDYFEERNHQIKFSIYGKKRPCISCSGRMEASKITDYNHNFGYFWKHGIEDQPEDAAKSTMRILLNETPSHVTFENGKRLDDYDTASDSE